jgi:hypothetical protein
VAPGLNDFHQPQMDKFKQALACWDLCTCGNRLSGSITAGASLGGVAKDSAYKQKRGTHTRAPKGIYLIFAGPIGR